MLQYIDTVPSPSPTVLDVEASGFGRSSYPIEVGYVRADGQAYCTLIRPLPQWTHWDPAAELLHGISRQSIEQHGRDAREVARRLNLDLHGLTVYCDGWGNDYSWLHALYEATDQLPAFRIEHVQCLLDAAQTTRWNDAKRAAASELGIQRHRASADARAVQQAVQRLRSGAS
jgi:hypothetical protein